MTPFPTSTPDPELRAKEIDWYTRRFRDVLSTLANFTPEVRDLLAGDRLEKLIASGVDERIISIWDLGPGLERSRMQDVGNGTVLLILSDGGQNEIQLKIRPADKVDPNNLMLPVSRRIQAAIEGFEEILWANSLEEDAR